jgi:hypothetical protein
MIRKISPDPSLEKRGVKELKSITLFSYYSFASPKSALKSIAPCINGGLKKVLFKGIN